MLFLKNPEIPLEGQRKIKIMKTAAPGKKVLEEKILKTSSFNSESLKKYFN